MLPFFVALREIEEHERGKQERYSKALQLAQGTNWFVADEQIAMARCKRISLVTDMQKYWLKRDSRN